MTEQNLTLRELTSKDDQPIKQIVQSVLEEYHDALPGTAYFDPELGRLSSFYQANAKREYWVVCQGSKVVGGGGVAEFDQTGTAEVQKLYLLPEARGLGWGKKLLQAAEKFARKQGYRSLYIETISNMNEAQGLYEHLGFKRLTASKSGTAHTTCDVWLEKKLS